MRFAIYLLIAALVSSGCVTIHSASVSDISPKQGRLLTGSGSEVGYLHRTTPNLDDVISVLTAKLQKNCESKILANVQTILSVRDWILAQDYEITMTCVCVAN